MTSRYDTVGKPLSPREKQVLVLSAAGFSYDQMSKQLYLGRSTIKTHWRNLFNKMGTSSMAGAVGMAFRQGILNPETFDQEYQSICNEHSTHS